MSCPELHSAARTTPRARRRRRSADRTAGEQARARGRRHAVPRGGPRAAGWMRQRELAGHPRASGSARGRRRDVAARRAGHRVHDAGDVASVSERSVPLARQTPRSPCRRSRIGARTFRRSSITSCAGTPGSSARRSTACRRSRCGGWQRTPGRATSASCGPCSSAPILVAKGPVLEIDEELLDESVAVGSYRLVSPLGIRRHGRGLAGEAPAPRPPGGREADSARRAAR